MIAIGITQHLDCWMEARCTVNDGIFLDLYTSDLPANMPQWTPTVVNRKHCNMSGPKPSCGVQHLRVLSPGIVYVQRQSGDHFL